MPVRDPIRLRERVEHLLGVDPASKPGIYLRMFQSAQVHSVNYALENLLSAGIATLGLVLNSPAVVIGAMLISPLMGPILSAGLALASADLYLGIKSLLRISWGVVISIAFAAILVWLLPFHSPTQEVLSRTNPSLLDLGVALLSGLAGAILMCRERSGATALPGVAIAVALMPPLCAVGFGIGSGFSGAIIYGAGLLFLTNLAAIIASAFLVFYIIRMDAPAVRSALDQSMREQVLRDPIYRFSRKVGIAGHFGDIGSLRWRIIMLLAVLAMLFVPLRKSLIRVRDEAVARAAVGEALRMLTTSGMVVSQEINPLANPIVIRLVVATNVAPGKIREAENLILQRTGRNVDLAVRKVASDEELSLLRERLAIQPTNPVLELASMRTDLIARLEEPLKEVWPDDGPTLQGYELGFDTAGTVVRIRYSGETDLDPAAASILANVLQSKLQVEPFRMILERQDPPPAEPPGQQKSK